MACLSLPKPNLNCATYFFYSIQNWHWNIQKFLYSSDYYVERHELRAIVSWEEVRFWLHLVLSRNNLVEIVTKITFWLGCAIPNMTIFVITDQAPAHVDWVASTIKFHVYYRLFSFHVDVKSHIAYMMAGTARKQARR